MMISQTTNQHRTGIDSTRILRLIFSVFLICSMAPALLAQEDTLSPAPGSYRLTSDDGVIRFPFEIFRGDIRYSAKINGHDVQLLLDDGFMWDQLLFWGSPRIDSLEMDYDGEAEIGGETEDADIIPARTASGITLSLPGVDFFDQSALITSYNSGTAGMWWGSEGQVSATFFKHFVVDINFDDMMITLIEPGKFVYEGSGNEISWKPMGFGPWSIPGILGLEDGRTVSMEFMMDLGYNDQLQLATKGANDIAVPKRALPASLGRNIQGVETLGHTGRLEYVNIGGYSVKEVIAAFVSEEHSDHTYHEAMIGLGLLSRFNLVFDLSRRRMFVEPNDSFGEPYEFSMSGFRIRIGQGSFDIVRVYPESPASEAGLNIGDRIARINDRAAAEWETQELRRVLRQEGATVKLTVLRNGQEEEVSIVLRRLI